MKYFFYVLVFFVAFSCVPEAEPSAEVPPVGVIDTTTFTMILADMHIVDAAARFQMFPDNRRVPEKYSQYLGVLKNYNVTKAQWDSTMTYYSSRPQHFDHLYIRVLEILSEKQAKIKTIPDSTLAH